MTEARIYGQYPEAKITQVDDYTQRVNFNLDEYQLFATEYAKAEPQAFPIRTYKDYKLDMNPDTPEIQVDPITHLLELFGSIGRGEYLWTQIIMKARKSDEWYGFLNTKTNAWFDPARKKIKELMGNAAKRAQEVLKESDIVDGKMNALLTDGEKEYVKALEANMGKLVFECGIRSIYVARRENFKGINAGGLVRLFDPQRSAAQGLGVTRGLIPFDHPWQDFRDILKNRERRKQFFLYQNRAYFYVPYDQSPIFMTPEELATIWHFPSSVVKTPSLNRVESRRAEAPANLPLGNIEK